MQKLVQDGVHLLPYGFCDGKQYYLSQIVTRENEWKCTSVIACLFRWIAHCLMLGSANMQMHGLG